jgi:Fe-S oxidoreductase
MFYTCTVNYNDPSIGIAAAEVLSHNGIRVTIAPQEQCCGMPYLDAGDSVRALAKVRANLALLAPQVRAGKDIVVLSPSCGLTIKQEYPRLVPGEESAMVAQRTFDVSEYLWKLRGEGKLSTAFKGQLAAKVKKVAYHAPCHTRAQFMGNRGASLIELVPGVSVQQVEQCSHHDGTWGVKQDSHDISLQYAQKLFNYLADAEADLYVSDCPLAANQIEHGTGRRPLHPMVVLKEAYGI